MELHSRDFEYHILHLVFKDFFRYFLLPQPEKVIEFALGMEIEKIKNKRSWELF